MICVLKLVYIITTIFLPECLIKASLFSNAANDVFLLIMGLYKNTLKRTVSEIFTGLIWKIKINKETGLLAIETRNSELKQVAFSVLNFHNGKIHFKENTYQESWNLSLEYLGKENLIIKAYENPNTPESKGIISVNLSDGSVIWQKFNISLNQVHEAGLQVYDTRILPRKYLWLDHLTSSPVDPPAQSLPDSNSIRLAEPDNSFKLPVFIKHQELVGEFFTLSHKDLYIVSFHELTGDFMQQRLIVYQGDSILLDDILISGIQKLQPEAFFMQQDHLFYIRNKQEIISYLV